MATNKNLHPAVQKLVAVWPVVAAAATALLALGNLGLNASAQINTNKDDIAGLKTRVDKLETIVPGIREDLAVIKQQGADTGARVEHIEHRLDEKDDRRTR